MTIREAGKVRVKLRLVRDGKPIGALDIEGDAGDLQSLVNSICAK